jgi:hypothetical protein
MTAHAPHAQIKPARSASGRLASWLGLSCLLCLLAAFAPTRANAAVVTIGSPLSVPATLNTAENLNYEGTNTAVPPAPDAPNGIFHTFHYGADTAIWNVTQASGTPSSPVDGAVKTISLEGCAQPAAGGPPPLTEIHFQDLTPVAGGAKINLSSAGFQIPVCGSGGASGSTVSTYEPSGLCVSQGDYVDFNDEGGYVPNFYRAGVPYQVLGAVSGSTVDSFMRNNGTNNGTVISSSDRTANDGFASTQNEELMMQVTIGTGPDETHICAGGTAGLPPALPPIRVSPQTDGVNHHRIVAIAVYCRLKPECKGSAVLALPATGHAASKSVGHSNFSIPGNKTSHMPIRVTPSVIAMVRRSHGRGVSTTLTAVVNGKTIVQTINVKIL